MDLSPRKYIIRGHIKNKMKIRGLIRSLGPGPRPKESPIFWYFIKKSEFRGEKFQFLPNTVEAIEDAVGECGIAYYEGWHRWIDVGVKRALREHVRGGSILTNAEQVIQAKKLFYAFTEVYSKELIEFCYEKFGSRKGQIIEGISKHGWRRRSASGRVISSIAKEVGVTPRTIQRDMDVIRHKLKRMKEA